VVAKLERLNREIKRWMRVVGAFADGESALVLVAARLRHMAGTRWETRRYLYMDKRRAVEADGPRAEGA
jgi:transposase-like protein